MSEQSHVKWDYTALAATYDKRADYAPNAIEALIQSLRLDSTQPIADIGAGTGKLTKELLNHGFSVQAVEPNDAMRDYGKNNTVHSSVVKWHKGSAEQTPLATNSVQAVLFGSSFNVVNKQLALAEAQRIAKPNGGFACLWNHRDLNNALQHEVESIIQSYLPDYHYGDRRVNQQQFLEQCGYFDTVKHLQGTVIHHTSVTDYIAAWRSHGTLQRQAGTQFDIIIKRIAQLLNGHTAIEVPYHTHIWCSQFIK